MTEAEWLACADPTLILDFLQGKASHRQLRLLAVACCLRIWTLLPVACKNLITVLESSADGLVATLEYQAAWEHAEAEVLAADHDPPNSLTYATASTGVSNPPTIPSVKSCMDTAASAVACADAESAQDDEYDATSEAAWTQERHEQVRLIRDIFGNPFRAVFVNPYWLTLNDGTVVKIAQAIYADRAFDRLPVLADALEDAGCHDAEILGHCRQPGPHVRGCWVVDLLLGRA
jgi:hypothetical protein